MDGDRVASTFDFMRGGGDEDDSEVKPGRYGEDRATLYHLAGIMMTNRCQLSLLSSERRSERNMPAIPIHQLARSQPAEMLT